MTRRLLVLAVALAAASGCGGGANRASGDFVEIPGIGETRIDVLPGPE